MKKPFAFVSLLAVLLLGCGAESPQNSDGFNFVFRYGYGGTLNELNTLEDTYRKDMVVDRAITTSLELSEEEVKSVEDKIAELKLFEDEYQPGNIRSVTSPCESFSLSADYGSMSDSMEWDCNEMTAARTEFVDFMMKLIDSQEEVQALPEPRGGYM